MAKDWKEEMRMDENLTEREKERFVHLITKAGIPSVSEYAEEKSLSRDDAQDEYWDLYGEKIRAARDAATC